jgi:hypothetical protein
MIDSFTPERRAASSARSSRVNLDHLLLIERNPHEDPFAAQRMHQADCLVVRTRSIDRRPRRPSRHSWDQQERGCASDAGRRPSRITERTQSSCSYRPVAMCNRGHPPPQIDSDTLFLSALGMRPGPTPAFAARTALIRRSCSPSAVSSTMASTGAALGASASTTNVVVGS